MAEVFVQPVPKNPKDLADLNILWRILDSIIRKLGGAGQSPVIVLGLPTMTDGQLVVGQTASDPLAKTVGGDVTLAASGAVAIGANAVSNAKFRQSAGVSVVGRSSGVAGNVADITASTDEVLRESGGALGFGTIATAGIANNAVTNAKLRTSAATSVVGRSAGSSGNVADISATTDQVLRESGGSLGFGTVATGGLTANSVTDAKLRQSAAVSVIGRAAGTTGNVADISAATDQVLRESGGTLGFGTLATGGLADQAVSNAKFRNSAATSVVGRSAGTGGSVADIAATTDQVLRESGGSLGFGTVATGGIAANAVTDAKLRQGAAKTVIGRSANSTGDVADIAASTDQVLRESAGTLGFGTVATGGLAAGAVTYAKFQDASATARILARKTAGSGSYEETTLSQALDFASTTQGVLLYRGAATWSALATGTAGQVLSTQGASANPQWINTPKLAYQDGSVPGGNTVANTAAETAFASSYTFPANSLAVGDVVRIKLYGVYSTNLVAPTLTGKVKLGGTVMLNTGALTTVAGVTNAGWSAEAILIVTAIGAAGTVESQAYAEFATAATTALSVNVANTATTTHDTTGTLALTVTVQWSAANASNTITLRQMTLEKLAV